MFVIFGFGRRTVRVLGLTAARLCANCPELGLGKRRADGWSASVRSAAGTRNGVSI